MVELPPPGPLRDAEIDAALLGVSLEGVAARYVETAPGTWPPYSTDPATARELVETLRGRFEVSLQVIPRSTDQGDGSFKAVVTSHAGGTSQYLLESPWCRAEPDAISAAVLLTLRGAR
jgi:hypothetical protein